MSYDNLYCHSYCYHYLSRTYHFHELLEAGVVGHGGHAQKCHASLGVPTCKVALVEGEALSRHVIGLVNSKTGHRMSGE